MKKAVFFDIDGTLLDCQNGLKTMTVPVKQAIRHLQQQGHYAFIATGRPYAFLDEAILNFGFDGFILTNGAQVIINNETIFQSALDSQFINYATTEFEKRNIQYMLQSHHYSYMKESCQEYYALFENNGISRQLLKTDFCIQDIQTQKIEMFCQNEDHFNFCLSLIKDFPEHNYHHSMNCQSFELYSKTITKATGIFEALNHLGISIEKSYAFGDGKNDIEMLSAVGCGIAMGNASDDLKSIANQITDPVANDGVAHGIHHIVLAS